MANCECCNSLGSSPKIQLLLSIVIVLLFIVLGYFGISIIQLANFDFGSSYGTWDDFWDEYLHYSGQYLEVMQLAYWFGAVVTGRNEVSVHFDFPSHESMLMKRVEIWFRPISNRIILRMSA